LGLNLKLFVLLAIAIICIAVSACAAPSPSPGPVPEPTTQPTAQITGPSAQKPSPSGQASPAATDVPGQNTHNQGKERVLPKLQHITISLPFSAADAPRSMMPMGETIAHPDPPNPGGHPGIDFFWQDPVPIIACADGTVEIIRRSENHPTWDVLVNSGGYRLGYTELGSYNESLKVGAQVKKDSFIGYPQYGNGGYMIHWELGYCLENDNYRLNPMTYFDSASRERLEAIWASAPYEHKDQFPLICNGVYENRHE